MRNADDLLFRALSDPTRRALFERLSAEGERTVGELTAQAGVSQPVVSKHLRVLTLAGLVKSRQSGRNTRYRALPAGLAPLAAWTTRMTLFWDARIDNLEDLLKRMDQ